MSAMQPLALRMPAVFAARSFSHDEVQTQTRNLNSPPAQDNALRDSASPTSPDMGLPIMGNPMNEPDYFNHFSPGTHETYIAATPSGSQAETTTWYMTDLPYELELDVYSNHRLDIRGTNETLEKAQSKFLKQQQEKQSSSHYNPTSPLLHKEYQSKTFNRVVITITPNPSKPTDIVPLSLRNLTQILGEGGLLGFFRQTNKYFETHFRVRDVSDAGRGRYVALGKIKRGTFRGSGGGRDQWINGEERGSHSPFYDGATLDGEHGTNAEYEAFRDRIHGMGLKSPGT